MLKREIASKFPQEDGRNLVHMQTPSVNVAWSGQCHPRISVLEDDGGLPFMRFWMIDSANVRLITAFDFPQVSRISAAKSSHLLLS